MKLINTFKDRKIRNLFAALAFTSLSATASEKRETHDFNTLWRIMFNKFLSLGITCIFTFNSVAFAEAGKINKPLVSLVQHSIVSIQSENFFKEYQNIKSWKDLSKVVDKVHTKDSSELKARIKMVEKQPFALPELTKSENGFEVKSKDKTYTIDFSTKTVSQGDNKFFFEGKNTKQVIEWMESSLQTTSFSSLFISEAHAQGVFVGVVVVVVAAIVGLVLLNMKLADCSSIGKAFTRDIKETRKSCEEGNYNLALEKILSTNKALSIEYFARFSEAECLKDLPKALSYLGINCLDGIEIKQNCHEINQLKNCMENKPSKASINNSSRESRKDSPEIESKSKKAESTKAKTE